MFIISIVVAIHTKVKILVFNTRVKIKTYVGLTFPLIRNSFLYIINIKSKIFFNITLFQGYNLKSIINQYNMSFIFLIFS